MDWIKRNLYFLIGSLLVILGLAFFVRGLEQGLFPIGESIAYAFARKGSLFWLLLFAFCLGFGTTVAEPALIAVSEEARIRPEPPRTDQPALHVDQAQLWTTGHGALQHGQAIVCLRLVIQVNTVTAVTGLDQ